MSEDRSKLTGKLTAGNDESEIEDVDAHRLNATDEPEADDEDVEAHRLV